MFCPKCGAENSDISFYCVKCGRDLGQVLAPKKFRIDPRAKETQAYFHTEMIIAGRYKILEQLGHGGRGVVYKALDQQLQMVIAIKFLPQEMADNPKAVEDLKREAKAAMMLTHQNIVRLYNFEKAERHTFLSMEYIDGQSLEESLQSRKRFTVNECIEYAEQVCQGLEYAHKRGLVHRDIKPANLMKTKEGIIKITDFGIAAHIHDCLKSMTKKTIVGTPLYMSPEQLLAEPLDHRSDIYSLGAALYEFLSSHPPFYQGSIEFQIVNDKPAPIPDIPTGINRTILKALEKNKEDRWDSALDFCKALKEKGALDALEVKKKALPIKERIVEAFKSIMHKAKLIPSKIKSLKAKKHLWVRIKPYILRHSILLLWPFIFAYFLSYLFPKLSGWTELFLLFSLFLQALIIGVISKIPFISFISLGILSIMPNLVMLDVSNSYLYNRGFQSVLIISLLFGLYSFLTTILHQRAKENKQKFWHYRDIILIGWALALSYLFVPCIEVAGIKIDPVFLFLVNAIVLGFLCRNLIISLILLPVIVLGWLFSQTEFSLFLANYRNLAAEIRVYSLLTSIKSVYIKLGEFAALAFVMTLGAKLSLAIGNQLKAIWKKTIIVFLLLIIFASLGVVAFWMKISQDTSIGDMVWVEPGEFIMGTNSNKVPELIELYGVEQEKLENEQPEKIVFLEGYYIDRFEVTNAQYQKFIEATDHEAPGHWLKGSYPFGRGNHPVVGVSWHDAAAYAKWAGKKLPNEMEWEKAARGNSGREYPWVGDSIQYSLFGMFEFNRCNINIEKKYGPVTVGKYIFGRSPWGLYDMAGNAMEWTNSSYEAYSGSRHKDEDYQKGLYVVRGGSWFTDRFYARSAARMVKDREEKNQETGFRCILPIEE